MESKKVELIEAESRIVESRIVVSRVRVWTKWGDDGQRVESFTYAR